MPRHCSAAGCNSRDTREARKSGLTFHRLPKRGNPRRITWILNSRRKGPEGKGLWDPQSDYIYFCSKHFTPDSFELSGVSGYRRLKDDAVPTVVETLPYQRRKASRGRGRPRNVERQMRAKKSADNEVPANKEVQIKEAPVDGKEAESSKPANGQQGTEQAPLPSLSEDVQSANQKSPHNQPEDLTPGPPSPKPPSPSCYMRRLPPPPGFYLAKEHNYAQLCPLVWRKRYDKAIDNLEKALRLLSAARRRENRLRLTLLRLRESRLKNTLYQNPDSSRRKEGHVGHGRLCSWVSQSGKAAKTDRSGSVDGLEESEIESSTEDMELLTEEGWRRQVHAAKERATVEEEEGCCFYCGRGREDEESKEVRDRGVSDKAKEALGNSKPKRIQQGERGKWRMPSILRDQKLQSTRNNIPVLEPKECYLCYCENDTNDDQEKTVSVQQPPQQQSTDAEASLEVCGKPLQQFTLLHPQTEVVLQMHPLTGPSQPTVTLQDATSPLQLQQVHLLPPSLGLQPGLILPDITTGEGNMTQSDMDRENHIYWVEERTDSHVLLVPVSAETTERSEISVDSVIHSVETQSILVTKEGPPEPSEEGGCPGVESEHMRVRNTALRKDSQNGHEHGQNMRTTMISGDVRQKLKEHLEGFQLQLSSEFID